MKAEIVRALEEGTWAELRVRDWDLRGAAQPTAPVLCVGLQPTVSAHRHRYQRSRVEGAASGDECGSSDGPAVTWYVGAHEAIRSARLRMHDRACALRLDSMNGLPRLGHGLAESFVGSLLCGCGNCKGRCCMWAANGAEGRER